MRNPDIYCLDCGHPWGVTEEVCPNCGFDPVGNEDDARANDDARAEYQRSRFPDASRAPTVVRASDGPEVREGNPPGFYYDAPGRPSAGPFRTQIEMIDHAYDHLEKPWRWFIPGYDRST